MLPAADYPGFLDREVAKHGDRIHNQVSELLSAYLDNHVTADERGLVESHLSTCPDCTRELAVLRQTVGWLRQLPALPVPRSFTVRQPDATRTASRRAAWWRPGGAMRWAAGLAVLACVGLVSGTLLIERLAPRLTLPGLGAMAPAGAPIARQPQAFEAANAATAKPAGSRTSPLATPSPASSPTPAATPVGTPTVPRAATQPEQPAAPAVPTAGSPAAGSSTPTAACEPGTSCGPLASHTITPAPTGRSAMALPGAAPPPPQASPPPAAAAAAGKPEGDQERAAAPTSLPATEAARAAPAAPGAPAVSAKRASPTAQPALLPVSDLVIQIGPGVITVTGRLPLPEGQPLLAEVWREGQPLAWAVPASQRTSTDANGMFTLRLQAQPGTPDFDLFAAAPAHYEIRIQILDVSPPAEARIPFDTFAEQP